MFMKSAAIYEKNGILQKNLKKSEKPTKDTL